MNYFLILLLAISLFYPSIQRTKEEWKNRKIYQLLTDRFARADGSGGGCDLHNYCGGNFQGIINHLDYISNLGFDAIWISPIIDNYDGNYHGYAGRDFFAVNSHFGNSDELKRLVTECHKKDIWVMVDIVANHAGNLNENYSQNKPFDNASHFHDYCLIQQSDFDTHNLHNIEHCRLMNLADLNHQNEWVVDQLLIWGKWLVDEFGFDGMRCDTAMMVPVDFWKKFTDATGVYTIGEVFDGSISFLKQFQGPLDGLLNYPLFFYLRGIFSNSQDMNQIENYYNQWKEQIGEDQLQYLGNFNDNHDNARYLYNNNDESGKKKFKAITAFCLTSVGIPIMYYGSEQYFSGGNDPENREVLWNNFDQNHEMYKFVQVINRATKQTNALNERQIQRWSSNNLYAFSRGQLFAAFSSKQDQFIKEEISYHPYQEGQRICNIFYAGDCLQINGGKFTLDLYYGEVKIFIPE